MGTASLPARILGIDPGPSASKGLAIFKPEREESHFHKVRAQAARGWVRAELQRCDALGRPLVIGWDAPRGVDLAFSYTQRKGREVPRLGGVHKAVWRPTRPGGRGPGVRRVLALDALAGCVRADGARPPRVHPRRSAPAPRADCTLRPLGIGGSVPGPRTGPVLAKGHVPKYKGRTTENLAAPVVLPDDAHDQPKH
jgi:hypothetical protein